MQTFFHCTLCALNAQGFYPKFTTEDEIVTHLDTAHDVPGPYFTKFLELIGNEHVYITLLDVGDCNGQIVGYGLTVMTRYLIPPSL